MGCEKFGNRCSSGTSIGVGKHLLLSESMFMCGIHWKDFHVKSVLSDSAEQSVPFKSESYIHIQPQQDFFSVSPLWHPLLQKHHRLVNMTQSVQFTDIISQELCVLKSNNKNCWLLQFVTSTGIFAVILFSWRIGERFPNNLKITEAVVWQWG